MNDGRQFDQYKPFVYIVACSFVCFLLLGKLAPQRVGDGSEYYALFYAWVTTLKPWMTSLAFSAYEQLWQKQEILELVPREVLESFFPALKLGDTADFNHFWFYSFLAYVTFKMLSLVGVALGAHQSFLLLHCLLLALTASVAFAYFRRRGVIVVLLMTFFSPMLWFLDKVHAEFFTFCITLTAIIFVYGRNYMAGAFFFGLASMQNPSFALIAFLPFCYRLVLLRAQKYSFTEVFLISGTIVAVLAHPVYYFLRFGVVTPQLLAGGAELGGNLATFYIWFLDPDLGLLPNWPLGVFFLLIFGVLVSKNSCFSKSDPENAVYFLFSFLFILVNILAHSSTTNLNSGATPGLARYALWYLPLLFPIILQGVSYLTVRKRTGLVSVALAGCLAVFSVIQNNPAKHENYSKPTWLSMTIQKRAPRLYDPPPEVFAERFSGVGEQVNSMPIRGVLGPDCAKILLFPGVGRAGVLQGRCGMDPAVLDRYAEARLGNASRPVYVNIDERDVSALAFRVPRGIQRVGSAKEGNYVLGSGWSLPEAWGVWSQEDVVQLVIPCGNEQFFAKSQSFEFSMKFRTYGNQGVKAKVGRDVLWEKNVSNDALEELALSVPMSYCQNGAVSLSFEISNPRSPFEQGVSSDRRRLGISFTEFEIK